MLRAQTAVWLMIAVAFISLSPGQAQAQECVSWSTFSCTDKKPVTTPAAQQEGAIRLGIISPRDAVKPDVRKLYRVDVTCNSTRILPAPREGIFNRSDVVTTHLIAITGKALTGQELPTDAKVLIPVYSVSTAKANQSDFTNKACNQSFFISGREPLFIAATANQTRTNTPGVISNLLYSGIKLFNPIAPLFAGATAMAALQPILNGIAATQEPLKQMFSQFDSKGTQTYSAEVYVGETNVRTPYSRTTVTVTPILSIIKTNNGNFIVAFEDALKGFYEEARAPALSVDAVAADCRSYGGQLQAKSFPADDIAYGLSYITRTAGLDKAKLVACLGKEYGLVSVSSFVCTPPAAGLTCIWDKSKEDAPTADDFTSPYPIQTYKAPFFKGLRNAMAKYAESGGGEPAKTELAKFFDSEITLDNLDERLPGEGGKVTAADLMQRFVQKDLTRFGCLSKDTQAAGLIFAFPRQAGERDLYKPEDVVALRNWIGKSDKVVKVEAFFQPGLVTDVAKPTLSWCGPGLHLAAPPNEEKKEGVATDPKPDGQ